MKSVFRVFTVLALAATLLITAVGPALANDAETLPEGVFKLGQSVGYAWTNNQFRTVFGTGTDSVTKWYNITVYLSDIADAQTAAEMDKLCKVWDPNTKTFKQSRCVLGQTNFDLQQRGIDMQTSMMFGITDRLTAGFIIPYFYSMSNASLQISNSNMGINYMTLPDGSKVPNPQRPIGPINCVNPNDPTTCTKNPLFPGVEHPTNAEDTNLILSSPVFGFNYQDPLGTHQGWYLRDIILGGRYNFYNSPRWKNSFTLFIITPTGQQHNYNYLFSPANGDGNWDIGFWINNDLALNKSKTVVFNFSGGYTAQLPQTKHFRLGTVNRVAWDPTINHYDPNSTAMNPLPIGAQSTSYLEMMRDIGDNVDLYLGIRWEIIPYLILSEELYYYYKWADMYELTYQPYACELVSQFSHDSQGAKYCGEPGADYTQANLSTKQLSIYTDRQELVTTTILTFSTLPFVQAGKFPLPMMVSVGYKYSIMGQNIEQSNAVFFSLDLIGHVCIFTGKCDQLGKEEEKKSAVSGNGLNYSLANHAN